MCGPSFRKTIKKGDAIRYMHVVDPIVSLIDDQKLYFIFEDFPPETIDSAQLHGL